MEEVSSTSPSMAMNAIKIQFISSIIILLPVSSLYHIYTIGLYIPTKVLLHATQIFWPQSFFSILFDPTSLASVAKEGEDVLVFSQASLLNLFNSLALEP